MALLKEITSDLNKNSYGHPKKNSWWHTGKTRYSGS